MNRQLIAVWLLTVAASAAEPNATTAKAREALHWCAAADAASLADRVTILSRGLQCAEEAAHADPGDATAHFAVFCNLGKLTRLRRDTAGWLALLEDVARAERALDQALRLAPDYPDAVAAKGQMLIELPRWLGGDPETGRALLRRASTLGVDAP
jgi:hypothetical protein